jgi:CubicO group peptidase (beta-lactamase class C family)
MTIRTLSLLCLAAATAACGATPPDRFAPIVAAVRADLGHSHATAASIAVWVDGEVRYVGGFGHANPDGTAPPDERTQFMIGSDTKKITALAMLREVAVGRTTLDARVGALLPELHMAQAPAFLTTTVRQLLSQQSGIADGVEETATTTDGALAAYADGVFAQTYEQLSPPGAFFNYANPNYSIAGLIEERLEGKPWADVVEQGVFAPLAMTRTVARKAEVDANHADGRGYPEGEAATPIRTVSLAQTWESAFVRPAGLVWSTPSDQMRLAAFLVDGDPAVLDRARLAELTAHQVDYYPETPVGYGFGVVVGRGVPVGGAYYDVPVWAHGGNTHTHTSLFMVLPEQRFAISILTNGVDDDFSATAYAAIGALAALPAPTAPPTRTVDASKLDALTGTYVDPHGLDEIRVTRQGDALALSIPALDVAGVSYGRVMTGATTRVWSAVIDGSPREVTFIDGPAGTEYLRTRELVAVRAAR